MVTGYYINGNSLSSGSFMSFSQRKNEVVESKFSGSLASYIEIGMIPEFW